MISRATIPFLDPESYAGVWHQLAYLPTPYQSGCVGSTAHYRWNPEKEQLEVVNMCMDEEGKQKSIIKGSATIPNPADPGKLKVVFSEAPPAFQNLEQESNYWIFFTDYDVFSIVGSPDGSSLWLLGREKALRAGELESFQIFGENLGYDLSKLKLDVDIEDGRD